MFFVLWAYLFTLVFFFSLSRKLGYIVLKKIGRVGGDEGQVRSRVRHILSKIDSRIAVDVAEVHTFFISSRLQSLTGS